MANKSLSILSVSKEIIGETKQFRLVPKHINKFGNKLIISTKNGILLIDFSTIEYCQADGNYTHVYLSNGQKVLSSLTLKKIDSMLDSKNFIRIHQSYVVSSNKIKMIKKAGIELESGLVIPMSRKYRLLLLREIKCLIH